MAILSFSGDYAFLSNFSPSPLLMYGKIYPTVEHAYQAAKTNNLDAREQIRLATTPGKAKSMGRRVVLRPDWESFKLLAMEILLQRKFTPGSELAQRLLATGDHELVEGNYWGDTFWGICKGKGDNHLGRLLMALRTKLSPSV